MAEKKLRSALIPGAIAQRPSGANIVERIARHRLADHPSPAIADIASVLREERHSNLRNKMETLVLLR